MENTIDDLKYCKKKSITKQYIDSKSLLKRDISNIKNKIEQFEEKYIDDNHPCDEQLWEASEIVKLYNLAKGSLLNMESIMEELQDYICTEMNENNENEIEEKLEELNNEYFHHEENLRDNVKK